MRPSHPPEAFRLARLLAVGGATLAAAGAAAPSALAADACPNAIVREQQAAVGLPDCRSYELVSPPEKAAQEVRQTFSSLRSSDAGDAVTYTGFGSFPGADVKGSVWMSRYLTRRGGDGWAGRSIDSEQDTQILSFASLGSQYQNIQAPESFTSDLSASTEQNFQVQLDPDHRTDEGVVNLFRRDYSDDSYKMMTVAGTPQLPSLLVGLPEFVAATPDRQRILFQSAEALTSDPVGFFQKNLYEWDQGTVRLVGLLPADEGGGPANGGSVSGPGVIDSAAQSNQARGGHGATLSDDGTRALFLEGNGTSGRLFMREGGGTPAARTVWLSKSEKAVPDSPQPVTFWGATPNGSKALFVSSESLVDGDTDSSADLYQYDLDAPAGSRLTRLSAGANPADAIAVLGTSSDQSSIYFVANGQLTGDAPAGPDPKVYLWSGGALRYVTTLAPGTGDINNWAPNLTTEGRAARVTDDGGYLLVESRAQLTSYDNRGFNELYLFDAGAPAGEAISCVSCRQNGSAPAADAVVGYADAMTFPTAYQPRMLVKHGDSVRVFFDSNDEIVTDDGNAHRDVYMYDHPTGVTSLLSSGKDPSDSYFMDASTTGDDAFITTRSQLSGWDRDPLYDVYDARVDSNLPEPAPTRDCVDGDCQGPPTTTTPEGPLGSATYGGPGDVQDELAPEPKPAPVRGKVNVASVRSTSSVVTLRVKAPGSGRLTVTGGAVASVRRSVSKAATYTVRLKLSTKAKKHIAKAHRLRVTVRVAFAPRAGKRSSDRASFVVKGHR